MKESKQSIAARIFKAALVLCTVLCAFVNIGTLLHFVPVWGDVASMAFLPGYPIVFALAAVSTAGSIYLVLRERSRRHIVLLTVSALSLAAFVFMSVFTVLNVSAQGEAISFFKCFAAPQTAQVVEHSEEYSDQNDKSLALSVFYTDDGVQDKPMIFYTHGGGWIMGTRYDRLQTTKALAQKGFVVVSAEYELSSQEQHLYAQTEEQLMCAIRRLPSLAASYGANCEKLYLVGDSAGGNLALNLAYKINDGTYPCYTAVKAVSVIYPVTSIEAFYETKNLVTSGGARKMALAYLGETPEAAPERYAAHNPENFIGSNTPPTLIVLGTADSSVPPQSAYDFSASLESAGIATKLVKVPYANHATDTAVNNFLGQAYINNTLEWFNQY